MIHYDSNSPLYACRLTGSNIPRSLLYALPSVLIAAAVHMVMERFPEDLDFLREVDLISFLSTTAVVLGVLLAMRTTRAYDRYWEGITLVQSMRAEWFETTSNLVAFSRASLKKYPNDANVLYEVQRFQFTLVRLMSLMHGSALRQIGGHEEDFEVLDISALDANSLAYLKACVDNHTNPVEVILHWIQELVTETATTTSALSVPAPILTRVYHTLSRGMVHCHNARKLSDYPFPFPLYQMVLVLLFLQAIFTPMVIAITIDNLPLCLFITFLTLFGMWSITFSAGELEQPFGNDPNDLPLTLIQKSYNTSLMMLLDRATARAPKLSQASQHSVKELRKMQSRHAEANSSRTDTFMQYNERQISESTGDRCSPFTSPGHRGVPTVDDDEFTISSELSASLGFFNSCVEERIYDGLREANRRLSQRVSLSSVTGTDQVVGANAGEHRIVSLGTSLEGTSLASSKSKTISLGESLVATPATRSKAIASLGEVGTALCEEDQDQSSSYQGPATPDAELQIAVWLSDHSQPRRSQEEWLSEQSLTAPPRGEATIKGWSCSAALYHPAHRLTA